MKYGEKVALDGFSYTFERHQMSFPAKLVTFV